MLMGQTWGDNECPFSGTTNFVRVWRAEPEARLGVWCAANASNSNTSMILFVCNEYCKNESLKHFYVHTGQNVVFGLHI